MAQLGVRHVLSKSFKDVQEESTAKTPELWELSHLKGGLGHELIRSYSE